jgi:hypothetical protein
MNRSPLLVLLLAAVLAACGGDGASQADATATTEPTASPTAEATASAEPAETDDGSGSGSGSDTALEELIPDELNGVARTDVPGMGDMIAGVLQEQGLNAEDAEFIFTSYGDVSGTDAVILSAFRIPGMGQAQLELFAQMMSGAQGTEGVETEQVDIGGKSVLRMTATTAGQEGTVFLYFAEDAAFTVISQDQASAEQLLAELP